MAVTSGAGPQSAPLLPAALPSGFGCVLEVWEVEDIHAADSHHSFHHHQVRLGWFCLQPFPSCKSPSSLPGPHTRSFCLKATTGPEGIMSIAQRCKRCSSVGLRFFSATPVRRSCTGGTRRCTTPHVRLLESSPCPNESHELLPSCSPKSSRVGKRTTALPRRPGTYTQGHLPPKSQVSAEPSSPPQTDPGCAPPQTSSTKLSHNHAN